MKFGLDYWGRLSSPVRRRKGWPSFTIVAMVATGLSSVVIAAGVATAPPASAGTPPAPPSGWTTTFSDSFSGAAGSGPNYNNWFYDIGTGFGTGEIEQMTSSTATCSVDGNGDLKLTAIESGGSWTSCRLESTLDNFYAPPGGQMEIEASIEQPNPPSGDGLGYWPAFWSLGSPGRAGGSWPTEGEIDMMEDVNAYNEASQTLHDSANSPGHALIACPTTGCQSGFNTYAVLINRVNTSAEYLEFIMDGTVEDTITEASVGTAAWEDAIDHGFYIIFDLAMGGNYPNGECGCTTPTSPTASGYSMLVNWVAVYQTSSTSGLNCNGYQGAGCNASPGTPTASGEITQAGNCLGNANNLNTEGNPIEVTACSGGSGQAVSLLSNSNIGLEGGCLDVVAAGTSPGSDVDWYPCNGTVAQDWTVETNGEIENPNSGLCLTNPANGSQLELEDCTGTSDQVWSVPSGGSGTTTTTTSPTTTTTPRPPQPRPRPPQPRPRPPRRPLHRGPTAPLRPAARPASLSPASPPAPPCPAGPRALRTRLRTRSRATPPQAGSPPGPTRRWATSTSSTWARPRPSTRSRWRCPTTPRTTPTATRSRSPPTGLPTASSPPVPAPARPRWSASRPRRPSTYKWC